MSASRLEGLPNEVLRQVLSECSPNEVIQSWSNINVRFNRLILSLNYKVGFIRGNVTEEDIQASLALRSRVISLVVSKRWCQLIPYFSSIQALRIVGWAYPFSFRQIEPVMLPLLKYVEYWSDFSWNSFMGAHDCQYAEQIIHCRARKLIDVPTIPCETLVHMKLCLCTSEGLAAILRCAPNLVDLDIGLYTDISIDLDNMEIVEICTASDSDEYPPFTPTSSHYFESITHDRLRRLKLRFDSETTLTWLDSFLLCTPNVAHFSLCVQRSYEIFSFARLHHVVSERLPYLTKEHFRLQYNCLWKSFDLEQHRRIGPLFATMTVGRYEHPTVILLTISVNWKSDDLDDEYDD